MHLSLVGLNHSTAPVAIREKAAINGDGLAAALSSLQAHVPRGIILSTCNRTEVYVLDGEGSGAWEAARTFLEERLGIPLGRLDGCIYSFQEVEAARHLFRVASGLESMIIGEHEVLGQMKQALETAEKTGMADLPLRHAFHCAMKAGRRVRDETGISRNALSVSSVAVELAAGIIGDLRKCRMLVIGAGEAGRLVTRVARERGVSQIVIASRTRERAEALASPLNGVATDLSDIPGQLEAADLVVTCAGAPHRILDVDRVQQAMAVRPGVPLAVIDIAVPRNVHPEVRDLPNVFLHNIDDLTEIAESNRRQRESEICRAEAIVSEEVERFISWWHDLQTRPVVAALMSKAEQIRLAHLAKTLKKLPPMTEEQRDSLEAMTRAIVAKVLRPPIRHLRAGEDSAETVAGLFDLDCQPMQRPKAPKLTHRDKAG